ncbi:MAG: dihydrolipoamide acetyltransferase family protein [Balneolales bacterium]
MARIEVVMPKMGESIMEGTIIEWSKKIGDKVEMDETLLEIATDKVDSEVPASEAGVLVEILAEAGDTIEVGKPIAIIETDAEAAKSAADGKAKDKVKSEPGDEIAASPDKGEEKVESNAIQDHDDAVKQKPEYVEGEAESEEQEYSEPQRKGSDGKFYSPLVRSIAKKEGISQNELESIEGSGTEGRVSKKDVLDYLEQRTSGKQESKAKQEEPAAKSTGAKEPDKSKISAGEIKVHWPQGNVEIVKMDRMRKVIAEHMVRSKQTSAHVTTFGEADVTELVKFRNEKKNLFFEENGYKLTFTPFFIEATIQALREYPLMNSSVDGDNIVLKRDINYGLAVALGESGTGGLVVPVIKNAGEINLRGIARATHELANKARNKKLSPDDLVGGTFTFTNYGSVGNLMGTPIINQPQVAIFGAGVIQKRPVVMEVNGNDVIAIRHMVYLSMSYDHRIIDGALGGAFVQRVKALLENFDTSRSL